MSSTLYSSLLDFFVKFVLLEFRQKFQANQFFSEIDSSERAHTICDCYGMCRRQVRTGTKYWDVNRNNCYFVFASTAMFFLVKQIEHKSVNLYLLYSKYMRVACQVHNVRRIIDTFSLKLLFKTGNFGFGLWFKASSKQLN